VYSALTEYNHINLSGGKDAYKLQGFYIQSLQRDVPLQNILLFFQQQNEKINLADTWNILT
jgi:hypothetical protein